MNATVVAVAVVGVGVVAGLEAGKPRRTHHFHASRQRTRWRNIHAQYFDVLLLPGVVKWDRRNGVRLNHGHLR